MHKSHFSLLHNLAVIALVILKLCPKHNINTIRNVNLQPFLNKRLFVDFVHNIMVSSCISSEDVSSRGH